MNRFAARRGALLLLNLLAAAAPAQDVQRITITASNVPAAPSVAGFGDDLPLARSPLAATVVAEGQRRDHGVQSIAGLTRLDAGVGDAYNAEGYWSSLTVRGFTLDNRTNYRRDGLPINAETALPLDNKSRLELHKGISGIQAGISAPGGLVNLVVKRPQRGLRSATIEARQGGSLLAAVDLSDRFGDGESLGWRVNAAGERLDPQARHAQGTRRLLALAGDAQLAPGTLIEAEIETSHQSQPSVPGFSLLGNAVPDARAIDPRTNLNNQRWSQPVVFDATTASLRLTQTLADGWRAQLHAMTQRLATDDRIAFPFGCSSEGVFDRFCSDGSVDLYDFRSEGEKRRSSAAELSLRGQIETGVLRHRLDVGWLSTRLETRLPPQAFNYAGSGRIDGSVQVDAAPLPLFDVQGRDERSSEVFLRDRIDLAADWQLWAGLRYSRLNRDGVRQSFTTPWLALAWQADEHTMAYTSWGRGVEAETAPQLPRYSNAGRALPALESRQFETGVKHANGGLEASLVGFAITRPQTGDFGACDVDASCVRAIDGSAQHRGIEASAATRHGPWRLQAGALMLHARREGAADATINGLAPVNVPARSLRAEVRYAPSAGSEVSALLVHEASRAALPDHSATIDSWTRLDLAVRHEQRLGQATRIIWRAAIDNATNRKAWRESPYQFSHAYLFPLAPRSLRVSAQFEL